MKKGSPAKKKTIYEFSIKECDNLQIDFVCVYSSPQHAWVRFRARYFTCMGKPQTIAHGRKMRTPLFQSVSFTFRH